MTAECFRIFISFLICCLFEIHETFHLCKLVSKHTHYLHCHVIFNGMNFIILLVLTQVCLGKSVLPDIAKYIFFSLWFPQDQHLSMLEYHVPVTAGGVANIFDVLETNKTALNITNFLVSQTTLEEVSWTPGSICTMSHIITHSISFQWHLICF